MKFPKSIALSLGCLTLLSPLLSAESRKLWAHQSSDIAVDAKVTYGSLPNGMRYILMPNQEPPGRVSMRLHIGAGSLMEREDQRGVAHFLEHMVFNGTKSFPDASKLIPQMQRLGIAFGAHANAYTSFDETVYKLDLPNNEQDTLKLGFDVMRDFGDGALLREQEIEKERGVILSEKTSRDSVQFRLMEKQFKALLPDALIAERFPIGTEEIIKSAPRSAFTDFYQDYYTPQNMVFVYVGDFNVAEAEKRIIKTFSSMTNPDAKTKTPQLGNIPSGKGFQTLALSDKEVDTTDLTLIAIKPFTSKPDTKKNRGEKLALSIANSILSNRISILSKKENATFSSGYAFQQNLFKFMSMGGITVNAKDHDWKSALPVAEQELRRAIEHGFTQSELNEVKANLTNQYKQAIKAAPTRQSASIASAITQSVHRNKVFSSPEEDLAVLTSNLEPLSPDVAHAAFKAFWDTQDISLILTTNQEQEGVPEKLKTLYKQSRESTVSKPEEQEVTAFAYSQIGKVGSLKQENKIKDLDISQMEFHNGCKCNAKHTDFNKNSVTMTARIGGGKLTMPKTKPGLDLLSNAVMNNGGLGKHSVEDLKRTLAGKNVNIAFSVSDDAFVFSGGTTPEDLELQLQLLCAYLTDPGMRPEAERLFKDQLPALFSQMKYTDAGAKAEMSAFIRGNDERFVFPKKEQLESYTTKDVKDWLSPALEKDYLELSIVGDYDHETLLPILEKTIGALPPRNQEKNAYEKQRLIANRPKTGVSKRYTFESKIPTGSAMVIWNTEGLVSENIGTIRRLGVLSTILSNRMREKIREELGESYSPYAGSQADDTFQDLGFIVAISAGKPEQAKPIGKLIIEIAKELSTNGATQDELERAIAPTLSSLKQSLRQNNYWLNTVMAQSQEQPFRLDWSRNRDKDYASITLEEVNTLAKQYLTAENSYRFEIVPVAETSKE